MSQPHSELYIDGLLDVSFARGIVRVDVYSYSATEKHASGQPKPELRQRMVMGSQAFVDFVGGLQLAVQSLRDKGALPGNPALAPVAQTPEPAPEPAQAPEPASEPARAPEAVPEEERPRINTPRSPNFPDPADEPQESGSATVRG
ncbi:MAG: hypothetical protein K9G59_18705 [Caulobacter sp.]|nr:hypothetical protein [Caulobacter sp.]